MRIHRCTAVSAAKLASGVLAISKALLPFPMGLAARRSIAVNPVNYSSSPYSGSTTPAATAQWAPQDASPYSQGDYTSTAALPQQVQSAYGLCSTSAPQTTYAQAPYQYSYPTPSSYQQPGMAGAAYYGYNPTANDAQSYALYGIQDPAVYTASAEQPQGKKEAATSVAYLAILTYFAWLLFCEWDDAAMTAQLLYHRTRLHGAMREPFTTTQNGGATHTGNAALSNARPHRRIVASPQNNPRVS